MPPQLMEPRTQTLTKPARKDPSVEQIIAAARAKPHRAPARGAWMLSGLTAVLLWASFTPLDWGSLAWLALVPLLLLVRIPARTRGMYVALYTMGLATTLASLQWMRLGDPTMYTAWIALSVYMAIYFPVFVMLSRTAVHRFHAPLTVAVPVIWVGLEYLRAHLMTGFAWYYLGHTQYRWVELIQISDLVGAYGVSFVVATASAALAGVLPVSLSSRLNLLAPGAVAETESRRWTQTHLPVVCSVLLVCAALTYGYVRRAQGDFREGPRVALIQANYPASIKQDPRRAMEVFARHYFLTGQAVRLQPDVVVWPETMYRQPLMLVEPDVTDEDLQRVAPGVPVSAWRDGYVTKGLANISQQAGAAAIVGIETAVAGKDRVRQYNSAAFSSPTRGLSGRYDKMHRVVFGEYIPLKNEIPWLHAFTPFSNNFGIEKGASASVFEHKEWRFAPIICFEDTVPQLVRKIAAAAESSQNGKPVDCLVNLTNDGWFHGSSELDQHLITALFRCVETRTPMVRAVNTGISAVIDGDGVVVEPEIMLDGGVLLRADTEAAVARESAMRKNSSATPDPTAEQDPIENAASVEQSAFERARISMRDPETGGWRKQLDAIVVDDVPLDDRTSLYVACGDWFAATCFFGCVCVFLGGFVPRRKAQPAASNPPSA